MAPKTPSAKKVPYFKSGAIVEISADDTGFRHSWYTGRIVRRTSTKTPSKFKVAYTHLFADDAGTKPLVEVFDSTYQLRPPPPPASEREKASFKFGDEVDAFYNDGWWEGTITKEMGDGKFKVYFRGSKEKIVFTRDQLRIHREWIDGAWDPPLDVGQDQKPPDIKPTGAESIENLSNEVPIENPPDINPTGGNTGEKLGNEVPIEPVPNTDKEILGQEIFRPGTLVEVSSDEDGFHGAWFTATVIKRLENDKFLVEYQNLRTDDDKENLKEEIDTQHIRPQPPEKIMIDNFTLYDEVDAWYNEAWWVGIVTKVRSNSAYTVFFKDTNEEIKFDHSDLRVHQDWIDGKWYTCSKPLKK